jgi:hypothetical protein
VATALSENAVPSMAIVAPPKTTAALETATVEHVIPTTAGPAWMAPAVPCLLAIKHAREHNSVTVVARVATVEARPIIVGLCLP